MNADCKVKSSEEIARFLHRLRSKGVSLWSTGGQLHYQAPKGALLRQDIEMLRSSKGAVGEFLASTASEAGSSIERIPLSFSQLAHWTENRLGERHAIRQIASATRWRGRLNVDALRRGVEEIVRRQSALRTRIAVVDEVPTQTVVDSEDFEIEAIDLTTQSEACQEIEVRRLIDEFILRPIDMTVGPLWGMRLLKLSEQEHVLILAMEHIISDAFSRGIFLKELFTAYTQSSHHRPIVLPILPVHLSEYAIRQRRAHEGGVGAPDLHRELLANYKRTRFPDDPGMASLAQAGWAMAPVKIGRSLRAELSAWCRRRQTTLVIGVLCAYIGTVLRWCEVAETVVQYATDGRDRPELQQTIGLFASILYLRVELGEADSLCDLLDRVTAAYFQAHSCDVSYVTAEVPVPDFTRSSAFNWVPVTPAADSSGAEARDESTTCSPIAFENPAPSTLAIDLEPSILLYDNGDEVLGGVHFPLNRFSAGSMERFTNNFLIFVKALVSQSETLVKDIEVQ